MLTAATPGNGKNLKVVVNFPYYFDTRSSMGVFFKDLYEAFAESGFDVRTACLNAPVEIPLNSYITPTRGKHKLTRFLSYYWQLASFMRKNSDYLLLNISQEFAFTPCPSRTVNIVHDLIQLRYPRTWWIRFYILLMLCFIRRSRLNIAVSATTQAILRQHGIQSTVLYNWFAIDDQFPGDPNPQKSYDGLFIGNQLRHKNMPMFLELAKQFPDRRFAAVVPQMAHSEISKAGPLPNLTIFSDLSQRDYLLVITQSKVLVSPSLDEGFGRPAMEASVAGAHLLLSDIPIYRELYNDVAVFFDVRSEDDLFRKFAELDSGSNASANSRTQAMASLLSHEGDPREYVRKILATRSSD